eukprot:8389456-Heterocapsa_arctica.AAC.1
MDGNVRSPFLEDARDSGKDEEVARTGSAESDPPLAHAGSTEVLTGGSPNDEEQAPRGQSLSEELEDRSLVSEEVPD